MEEKAKSMDAERARAWVEKKELLTQQQLGQRSGGSRYSPIEFSMIPPVKYHMWYHVVSLWWYHELVVFCWWYQARDTTSSVNQWRDTT